MTGGGLLSSINTVCGRDGVKEVRYSGRFVGGMKSCHA